MVSIEGNLLFTGVGFAYRVLSSREGATHYLCSSCPGIHELPIIEGFVEPVDGGNAIPLAIDEDVSEGDVLKWLELLHS